MPVARTLTLLMRPGEPDGDRAGNRQHVGDRGCCTDGPAHHRRRPTRVGPLDQRPMRALAEQKALNPRSVLPGELSEGVRLAPGEVFDISGARAQCPLTAVEAP